MFEKLKYRLWGKLSSKQIRLACLAVMSALTIAVVTLLGNSIHTVNVFDGERHYSVRVLNGNVLSVLSKLELKSTSYNIKDTKVSSRSTSVEIEYTYPVYVTNGDKTIELSFTGGTVEDALKQAGFNPDEHDFIEPAIDTVIKDTVYIDYTNIDYIEGSYEEKIPYKTETVYSSTTDKGVTNLVQQGVEGLKRVDYTEKLVNGISEGKTVVASTVVTDVVNAKKVVGTKEKAVKTSADVKAVSQLTPSSPIELDANGNPVSFKSKMTVRATAYTYTGHNCATGVAPKPGYIAVNPAVIPYGTKLYIKSPDGSITYGYAIAADTGGFIKKHPNGVDLFYSSKSACTSFGVRNMEIYILE